MLFETSSSYTDLFASLPGYKIPKGMYGFEWFLHFKRVESLLKDKGNW